MKGAGLSSRALGLMLVIGEQALAQQEMKFMEAPLIRREQPLQYFMEFEVGEQKLKGLLDTGSSDLTVPQAGSDICKLDLQQCDDSAKTNFVTGAFDPKQDAKVKNVGEELNASFTGGASFQGEFIKAPFRTAENAQPIDLQMGLVQSGNPPSENDPVFPVIGLGPLEGESTTDKDPRNTYLNIPAQLKSDKMINSNVFGLSLGGSQSNDNGSIIFGACDFGKMDGPFEQVPIESQGDGSQPSFVVNLNSVRVVSMDGSDDKGRDGGKEGNNGGDKGNRASGNNGGGGQQSRQTGGDRKGDSSSRNDRNGDSKSGNDRKEPGSRRWAGLRRALPGPRAGYAHRNSKTMRRQNQQDGNILSDELPPVVLVDSGAPGVILPEKTVQAIAKELGTTVDQKEGILGPVERSRIQNKALAFGMGDVTIKVPLESMLMPPSSGPQGSDGQKQGGESQGGGKTQQGGDSRDASKSKNEDKGRRSMTGYAKNSGDGSRGSGADSRDMGELPIFVGSADDPGGISVLGAPPMQSMYVGFDMEAKVLRIAQAKTGQTKPDIRDCASSANGKGGQGKDGGNGDGGGKGQKGGNGRDGGRANNQGNGGGNERDNKGGGGGSNDRDNRGGGEGNKNQDNGRGGGGNKNQGNRRGGGGSNNQGNRGGNGRD